MALITPVGYPIDNAFRLAGFTNGRPVGGPGGRAVAATWPLLVELFSDDLLNELITEVAGVVSLPAGVEPHRAFDLELAALLLDTCLNARITPIGRLIETTEGHIGNAQFAFDAPETVVRVMERSIRRLRENAANQRSAIVLATIEQALADRIIAHFGQPNAHHAPPDVSGIARNFNAIADMETRVGINEGNIAQQSNFLSTFADRVKGLIAETVPDWAKRAEPPFDPITGFLGGVEGYPIEMRIVADALEMIPAWAKRAEPPDIYHPLFLGAVEGYAQAQGGLPGANSITHDMLQANIITARNIVAKAITNGLLADAIIDDRVLRHNIIGTRHIEANAVTEAEMSAGVQNKLQIAIDNAGILARQAVTLLGIERSVQQNLDETQRIRGGNDTYLGGVPIAQPDSVASLTLPQQIGLLDFRVDPVSIIYPNGGGASAIARQYSLIPNNPSVITQDLWVEGLIQGQPGMARTKWTDAVVPRLELPVAGRDAIIGAIELAGNVDLTLNFYDAAIAGNLLSSYRRLVSLTELPKIPSIPPQPSFIEVDATLVAGTPFASDIEIPETGIIAVSWSGDFSPNLHILPAGQRNTTRILDGVISVGRVNGKMNVIAGFSGTSKLGVLITPTS